MSAAIALLPNDYGNLAARNMDSSFESPHGKRCADVSENASESIRLDFPKECSTDDTSVRLFYQNGAPIRTVRMRSSWRLVRRQIARQIGLIGASWLESSCRLF